MRTGSLVLIALFTAVATAPAEAMVRSPGPPPPGTTVRPRPLVDLPKHEFALMYVRRARLHDGQSGLFRSDMWVADWALSKAQGKEMSWGPSVGYDHVVRKGERRQVVFTTIYGRYDLQPDLRMGAGLRVAAGAVNYLNGGRLGKRARWTEATFSLGIPVHFHWDDQWNLEGFYLVSRRSRVFLAPRTGAWDANLGLGLSFSF
jgi:hypothetical protein